MAGKLLALLILLGSLKLYNEWCNTVVPDDILAEDVWLVRLTSLCCRMARAVHSFLLNLNLDANSICRYILYTWGSLESFALSFRDSAVMTHDEQMAGIPVVHFKYNNAEDTSKPGPVVIHFHGGGWQWFAGGFPRGTLLLLAERLQIPIISVSYRLAPEHPYPAALEDCLKVTNYVLKYHKKLAVDPNRIIVAGESSGGNLAAAVALKLKEKIHLQILIYPTLQALDFQTTSYRENAIPGILSTEHMVGYTTNYLGLPPTARTLMTENRHISETTRASKYSSYVHSDLISNMNVTRLTTIHHSSMSYATDSKLVQVIERRVLDPYFSPLMADSLDDVADAYVITAQHDVLRDDGLYYCSRLNNATNVKCELRNYEKGVHGFLCFVKWPMQMGVATKALDNLVDYVRRNVM